MTIHKCENPTCNIQTQNKHFCSKECQYKAIEKEKIKLNCPICGDVVYLSPWQVKSGHDVTCGKKECKYQYRSQRFRGETHCKYKPKVTQPCAICGEPVITHISQMERRTKIWGVVFCSTEHKAQWMRIPGNAPMYIDGRAKERNPYCEKFNENFRNRVRAFFGYRCGWCGTEESSYKTYSGKPRKLNVHHVKYNKRTCCDDSPKLFIPLCPSCHSKTSPKQHRDEWEELFEKLLMERYGGKCYYTREEYATLFHPQLDNPTTTP